MEGTRKLFDMTLDELEELLVFAGVDMSLVETIEEMEGEDEGKSIHPKYFIEKCPRDGDIDRDHFVVNVWERGSDADCYPWYVHMGEVVMPYGLTARTLGVVKWFLDRGFDVWGELKDGA